MANVNKIVNKMNKQAMKVIEDEVAKTVGYVEDEVLDYYLGQLASLYQALDILYEGLEKANYTKYNRKDFEEIVESTFNAKLTMVMKDYLDNSHDMALNIGRKQYSEEFGRYMKEYYNCLYSQGVKPKRIAMESRKLQYTMSRRFVIMLNCLGDNVNNKFVGCCDYLLSSMEFFKQHYTIDASVPSDIEIEIEREGYIKITDVKDMIELVEKNGFTFKRQNGTSHRIYENADGKIVVVPVHGKTFNVGLGYAIQREIKMA